jgi:hypothetical protein
VDGSGFAPPYYTTDFYPRLEHNCYRFGFIIFKSTIWLNAIISGFVRSTNLVTKLLYCRALI